MEFARFLQSTTYNNITLAIINTIVVACYRVYYIDFYILVANGTVSLLSFELRLYFSSAYAY